MDKPWNIDLDVYADEAELLAGLRRRDRLACTCLLKRFAPGLYRLALQLTASADDAEDVLQDGFIQACKEIDAFEGRGSLGGWLHRIVRNAGLMRLRRRVPAQVSLSQEPAVEPSALHGAAERLAADPDVRLLTAEMRDTIERAIMQLPERLRSAVVLRDVEGLSTAEAAAELGITEAALKVRLHRARLALKAAIAPYLAFGDEQGSGGAQ